MILGIKQDMETLIQASNGRLWFAIIPIQLRLANQHQRGKVSRSGLPWLLQWELHLVFPEPPELVAISLLGPPVIKRTGQEPLERGSNLVPLHLLAKESPVLNILPLLPEPEPLDLVYSLVLQALLVKAMVVEADLPCHPLWSGRAHLAALKAPGTDNRSNCPPVPPSSEGNGGAGFFLLLNQG